MKIKKKYRKVFYQNRMLVQLVKSKNLSKSFLENQIIVRSDPEIFSSGHGKGVSFVSNIKCQQVALLHPALFLNRAVKFFLGILPFRELSLFS